MKLTCYPIDDEFHALEILCEYIRWTPGLELIGQSTKPLTALHEVTNIAIPDLLFLDVDMPELSGLQLATLVHPKTIIIFTTSFREYAVDAFEKDAADYLVKPIFYDRFLKSIQKVQKLITAVPAPKTMIPTTSLFIKTGIKGQMQSILVADIIYAAAALNYVEIFLKHGKVITYLHLNEMLEKLPKDNFSRIHKSYLVNHQYIQTMEYTQVRLTDNLKTSLPIGRTFRANFKEKMNDYLLISKRDHPA